MRSGVRSLLITCGLGILSSAIVFFALRSKQRTQPPLEQPPMELASEKSVVAASRPPVEAKRVDDPIAKTGSKYGTVGLGGRLTPLILEYAGVKPDRYAEVQDIVDQTWEELSEGLKSRRTVGTPDPKAPPGSVTYLIPKDHGEGLSSLEKMAGRLKESVGSKAADILMAGIPRDLYFAGFGQHDLTATVMTTMNGAPSNNPRIKYKITGEKDAVITWGTGNDRDFNRMVFGTGLDP